MAEKKVFIIELQIRLIHGKFFIVEDEGNRSAPMSYIRKVRRLILESITSVKRVLKGRDRRCFSGFSEGGDRL